MYKLPGPDDPPKKLRKSNVPDLDGMTSDELLAFYANHQGGNNSKYLFPQGGQGTKEVTAKLAKYAFSTTYARMYREHGDVSRAREEELLCDWIYKSLPKYAQWGS